MSAARLLHVAASKVYDGQAATAEDMAPTICIVILALYSYCVRTTRKGTLWVT